MPELFQYRFAAMGTECSLHLYAADRAAADEVARRGVAEVRRIEARYSRYRSDSDLSKINEAAAVGAAIDVDDETGGLLDYAFAAFERSDELFDISSGILRRAWDFKSGRLPSPTAVEQLLPFVGLRNVRWRKPRLEFTRPGMELDFGGLAKEYAADRVGDLFRDCGATNSLIDLGGDIRVVGPSPAGEPWQITIRHPRSATESAIGAALSSGALATSGDYERCLIIDGRRFSHLLNPKTGYPVSGLSSVSVIAERCLVAGTLSTIAMLQGREGVRRLAELPCPCFWVDTEGRSGTCGRWPTSA